MEQQDYDKFLEFMVLLGEIVGVEASEGKLRAFWTVLKKHPADKVFEGFDKVISKPKLLKWPVPGDILEAFQDDADAKALQAWAKVQYAIRVAGSYRSVKFDDPVIHHAISVQGGWQHLCSRVTDDEMKFYRPQWLKAYKAFEQKRIEGALPEPPALVGIVEVENQRFDPGLTPPPVMITSKLLSAYNKALGKYQEAPALEEKNND